jgi:predicted MFS family arabinose efflux permease
MLGLALKGASMWSNRWFILAILFVTRFCLGYQFQSAGSVAPFLISEFALDYRQIGTLVGLFMLPGLILALPGGLLGKRFGDKPVVMMGMATMILGGVISGMAQSYPIISVGRLISGVGGVFLVVLMTKMVTDWFADKELFVGMAIFIIGWPVGIAAAQASQASLAETNGWSVVFLLTAIMMTLALASMALFYRDAPVRRDVSTARTAKLNREEVWLVCIAGAIWMFINGAYVVLVSFGPTLVVERGASVAEATEAASIMSWVFLFALPMGGWLSARYKAPNAVMIVGLSGSVIAGLAMPFVGAAFLTFALFGIAFAIATPVIATLPAEILRPENRARGFGVYYIWYYAGSALLAPVGGMLRDTTGTATTTVLFSASMMFVSLCLLGLLRWEQARRRFRAEGKIET